MCFNVHLLHIREEVKHFFRVTKHLLWTEPTVMHAIYYGCQLTEVINKVVF
jgi:hypothetical protein